MLEHSNPNIFYGTTILCARSDKKVVIAGDGQVSLGNTVLKSTANKIRTLNNSNIVTGFAGSTADALTLFERLEEKLEKYHQDLTRACVELAKDWRTDKYLRRLEAMMIVANAEKTFILTGNGDVLEPDNAAVAIGSGGHYALSAALALLDSTKLDVEEIVKRSMKIASDICVFTNNNLQIKTIDIP